MEDTRGGKSRGRTPLSQERLVSIALELIDEKGGAALTLATVASRAKVASPSLYKHVDGLAKLKTLVEIRLMEDLTDVMVQATIGRSGAGAIRSLMQAYRNYAVSYPNRYAVIPPDPLHDPTLAHAAQQQLHVVQAVLDGCGITGSDAIHHIRILRAASHGFAHIEAAGGFGLSEDIEETYTHLTEAIVASTRQASPSPTTNDKK